MNYPDSVQFLYALGNEIKTAKFGLERIRARARMRWAIRRTAAVSSTWPAPTAKVRPAP